MGLITTMLFYWIAIFAVYMMLNRGIWVFTDVSKSMSMFMLEKALGPAIDFAEGRQGSGAKAWIMQGAFWLILASALTFCGLWLGHDPTALHSLGSWGYSPTSETLLLAGNLVALFGAVGMLLIGAGLHIVPTLGGTQLASERNAALMSFVWTLSVLIIAIGAHKPVLLGLNVLFVGTAFQVLSLIAVIVNQLLTAASRTRKMALPAWLIIIGLLSDPISTVIIAVTGGLETGLGQWLLVRMVSGGFFFLQVAGVSVTLGHCVGEHEGRGAGTAGVAGRGAVGESDGRGSRDHDGLVPSHGHCERLADTIGVVGRRDARKVRRVAVH